MAAAVDALEQVCGHLRRQGKKAELKGVSEALNNLREGRVELFSSDAGFDMLPRQYLMLLFRLEDMSTAIDETIERALRAAVNDDVWNQEQVRRQRFEAEVRDRMRDMMPRTLEAMEP